MIEEQKKSLEFTDFRPKFKFWNFYELETTRDTIWMNLLIK